MPLQIYRLRRWLAATAVLLSLVVAGMYFYARSRARDVLKEVPGKIGYDIKQTANGFQISKSDGKRTLFTVQASNVKEFKLNGRAELHNVNIVLYGRDSSRFDQIYGDDFSYDPKTGDVTATGEVQIDLVANPAGLTSPDQTTPKELKNPIHLKTSDLVFNKETGNASTDARVEFRTPQATGSAVGVKYAGKSNILTLASQIHLVLTGASAATVDAQHGIITNDPRQIVLDHPRLVQAGGTLEADQAVFYLNRDNHVERVLAMGNVRTVTEMAAEKRTASSPPRAHSGAGDLSGEGQASEIRGRADQGEFLLTGDQDRLRLATFSGNVHVEQTGARPMQSDAGRLILDFAGDNELQKAHALEEVRLTQTTASGDKPGTGSGAQDFQLTAPAIDFMMSRGHVLERAVTSGAAQITITSVPGASDGSEQNSHPQRTVVTAGRFEAQFATNKAGLERARNYLATMHGAPDARIVSSSPGQPDRVSTSESVDATFLPQGGIASITQQGNVAYLDNQAPDKRMQAWASSARYTPADQMLVLTGAPRVANGSMATTANSIRIDRATGDAVAEGDVKSTYSDLKEQPEGALLASSSPIHVTARSMAAHNVTAVALYSGNARLWQDANVIEAPSIQFDRDRRSVTAQGTTAQPVQTILVQARKTGSGSAVADQRASRLTAASQSALKSGNSSPIAITATKLTYADSERKAHYEGDVVAKGEDLTVSAKSADAYLLAHRQVSNNQLLTEPIAGPGQLDHIVALGNVVIQQPTRRAEGQQLVYTAADDKFVLTGGPPSIFDAEQGKITGVSLTFYKRDDRVLVEGEASTPVVTQTRVAR